MMSGLVGSGTKALGGHRFSLVNLLPVTLLAILVVGLVRAGAYRLSQEPDIGKAVPEGKTAVPLLAALVFIVFLVAVLLQPFQVGLVRLLEGYWSGRGLFGAIAALRVRHHLRLKAIAEYDSAVPGPTPPEGGTFEAYATYAARRRVAEAQAEHALLRLERYPVEDDRVLPTTLGNILRSGEDGAGIRYGLDAMTVYPRIYPYISARLDAVMSRQLDVIDSVSALCVSLGMAAVAASPLLLRFDPWTLVPVGLAAASCMAYVSAKASAKGHGLILATVIDLHRWELLDRLHYRKPQDVDEEWELNGELSRLLSNRVPAHDETFRLLRHYDHGTLIGGSAPSDAAPATRN
jgi:hypothetical protein